MAHWTHRIKEMMGLGKLTKAPAKKAAAAPADSVENAAAANPYANFNPGSVVTTMLRHLQAKWHTRPIDEGQGTDYHFVYQRGDFHVLVRTGLRQARVHFLFFCEQPLGQLDNVRTACNHFNQHYPELKAIYSIDAEQHKIHVHLTSSIRLTLWNEALESDFADMLSVFFEAARTYRKHLDDIIAEDINNLEEHEAFSEREAYLAYETEMEHQDVGWHSYDTSHLFLADAMAIALGASEVFVDNVKVIVPTNAEDFDVKDAEVTEDPNAEVADSVFFDLTALALSLDPVNAPVALLHFDVETLAHKGSYIMRIEYGYPIEDTQFFRITLTRLASLLGPHHALTAEAESEDTHSFVMSYRPMDEEKKQAEFDYMWREAMDKRALDKELSDEQRFITLCERPDVGFNLYWGRRFYLAKNYYQALLHLENAYAVLHRRFQKLEKRERLQFYELSYYIGLCHMHLGQPKQAYFYLDGLYNLNNIRYTQAYVNALVRSRDYRAPQIVINLLSNVSRVYEEQHDDASEANREQLRQFILFLRRTMARIYLNDGLYDEAEKTLRELLPDDKDHEPRLLELLAEVARLRAIEASENADRSTLSVSAEFPKADNSQNDQ